MPTCSLGEPERVFKLVVCEIGQTGGDRRLAWDGAGELHVLGSEPDRNTQRHVVPLNGANPTLGKLEPPHAPTDRRPRLEIAFGVNSDRWLCTTVKDLRTGRILLRGVPVVRLL